MLPTEPPMLDVYFHFLLAACSNTKRCFERSCTFSTTAGKHSSSVPTDLKHTHTHTHQIGKLQFVAKVVHSLLSCAYAAYLAVAPCFFVFCWFFFNARPAEHCGFLFSLQSADTPHKFQKSMYLKKKIVREYFFVGVQTEQEPKVSQREMKSPFFFWIWERGVMVGENRNPRRGSLRGDGVKSAGGNERGGIKVTGEGRKYPKNAAIW